jgi:hypothetical protein
MVISVFVLSAGAALTLPLAVGRTPRLSPAPRLHPLRFRTQYCKQGRSCARRLCFFAHSPEELRSPSAPDGGPLDGAGTPTAALAAGTAASDSLLQHQGSLGGGGAPVQALLVSVPQGIQLGEGPYDLTMFCSAAPGALMPEAAPQQFGAPGAYAFVAAPDAGTGLLQQAAAAQQAARQRRMSYEERNALRMRAYLEQQRVLALAAAGSTAAAVSAAATAGPELGLARAAASRRGSAASYCTSYGGLLGDLPESAFTMDGSAAAGARAMASRRGSAASYCTSYSGLLGDLPESASMMDGVTVGPLGLPHRPARRGSAASYCTSGPGGALALLQDGGAPECQLMACGAGGQLRRASAASYASYAAGGPGALADGAAPIFAGTAGGSSSLMPPRGRRASAASYSSSSAAGGVLASGAFPGGVAVYAAPRARRASFSSSMSGLSFGGAAAPGGAGSVIMVDSGAQPPGVEGLYFDLDLSAAAMGGGAGAMAVSAALSAGAPPAGLGLAPSGMQQVLLPAMPEEGMGGPLGF